MAKSEPSMMMCKHANECPNVCSCHMDCACWRPGGMCRKRYMVTKFSSDETVPVSDLINKPPHYRASNGVETWDVINGFGLGYERGNAVKYLTRAGRKDGIDALTDLLKAKKYIERAIKRLESGEDIKNV